jgi:nitroreductase
MKPTQKQAIGRVRSQDAVREKLIAAAIRAPSGDNTQPWRFVLQQDPHRIAVYMDEARDPSPMNAGQRMSRVACGAAVENMLRMARAIGWEARLEADPGPALAVIVLDNEIAGTDETAIEAIDRRVTNRRLYDRRPVSEELLTRLKSGTPVLQGVSTHWLCGRDRISRLAAVIGRADAIMFGERSMRRAFLSNVRFDAAYDTEVTEGLSLACLETSIFERIGMRTMFRGPDWILKCTGGASIFAARARNLVESASGLCMLVASDGSAAPHTDLLVGRALQRAWLALQVAGLAVQPVMSLLVLENIADQGKPELIASLGPKQLMALRSEFRLLTPEVDGGRPAFLMRFGFAPAPSGRTGRLPLVVRAEGARTR